MFAKTRSALSEVFSIKKYIFIAIFVFFGILFLALWFPNISLLTAVLSDDGLSLAKKIIFFFSSFLSLNTSFTQVAAIVLIVEALLFGLNVAMLVYHFNFKRSFMTGGTSIGGMLAGFFGIGCASCGSVLLSLFGFSGAVLLLPFNGSELSVISVVLLLISLHILIKRISEKACKIQ